MSFQGSADPLNSVSRYSAHQEGYAARYCALTCYWTFQ